MGNQSGKRLSSKPLQFKDLSFANFMKICDDMWLGLLSGPCKLKAPSVSQESSFWGRSVSVSVSISLSLSVSFFPLKFTLQWPECAFILSMQEATLACFGKGGPWNNGTMVYIWHKLDIPHVFRGQQLSIC